MILAWPVIKPRARMISAVSMNGDGVADNRDLNL
jgi:hypothetical protein